MEDQTRHSIITLQALNYSGSGVSINIEGLPYNNFSLRNIIIAALALVIVFVLFIIKKFYKVINFTKIYEKFK